MPVFFIGDFMKAQAKYTKAGKLVIEHDRTKVVAVGQTVTFIFRHWVLADPLL
jgi:hypothetical protein